MKFSIYIFILVSFILFFLISCGSSEKSKPKDQMDGPGKVKRYVCKSGETAINFIISEPATKDVSGKAPPDSAVCSVNYSGPNKKGSYHGGNLNDCESELLKLMDKYKSQNYTCYLNNSVTQTTELEEKKYVCEKYKEIDIDIILSKPSDSAVCSVNYSGGGKTGSFNNANMSDCENKLQKVLDEFVTQSYNCHLNDNSIEAALSELQGQINAFYKHRYNRPKLIYRQDFVNELQKQFDDLSQRTSNGLVLVSCLCRDSEGKDPRFLWGETLRAGGVSESEAIESVKVSCEKYYQKTIGGPDFHLVIMDCKTRIFKPKKN